MMHEMYRDYLDGQVVPDITITKREDNGHFVASAMGITVTHWDQSEAVNRLTAQINDGILKGDLHPNS
jgi:hypothetical protein